MKLTCLWIIFPIEVNQQNIPMPYLLNLQLLQKEREERHGKRFVMDSSRMKMADKSIPNMENCGVYWMVSGSCLNGLVSLLLDLSLPITYVSKLYITCMVNYTARHYRLCYSLYWRHVMMTCLTWRTLQSKVFVLHFNHHLNMTWSERRKTANENWFTLLNRKQRNGERREIF